MIDFEYWFDNVVGDCELICNERALTRVWVEGDKTITSIHYYDELYEQLFGDLHLNSLIDEFAPVIGDVKTINALRAFAEALRTLDNQVESHAELKSAKNLLASAEWAEFRRAAFRILDLPYAQNFRNSRKTPVILQWLKQIESEVPRS